MNGTSTGPVKCAIWARVSTREQHNENQLYELREWAARRGLEVAQEFITEDSAWQNGNGAKGKEFDAARAALLDGARLGRYTVALVWNIDRLSRRGIEDTLATMRRMTEFDCVVWSYRQSWVEQLTGPMREIFIALDAWRAEQESITRSERIKAGMDRRKRQGKPVGGRKAGSGDRKKRDTSGYKDAWAPGGKLRVAREQRLAAKRAGQDTNSGEDQEQ